MTPQDTVIPKQLALVGRQAIFDSKMEVFAYELLYREGQENAAQFADGDEATARVMANTFLELGIDQMVGNAMAFINLTGKFFLDHTYEVLPTQKVVLEVLESIEPTPDILEALSRARSLGYQIALDDFVARDSHRSLLEIADLVKVDVLDVAPEALSEQLKILKEYPLRLLAEKVENQQVFERCVDLGFHYFQGYFFGKPQIIEGVRLTGNRMAIVMLLAKLQDPNIAMEELEKLVRNDLALSVKLLLYVNSAFVGLPKTVETISQAVCMVGTQRLQQWSSLLILASVEGKPLELMRIALIRARMCELVGEVIRVPSGPCFTVGLFSVLDAFFDCEMPQLVAALPISEDIRVALLSGKGQLGEILGCVIGYEHGEWSKIECSGVEPEVLGKIYWQSVDWATEVMNSVGIR